MKQVTKEMAFIALTRLIKGARLDAGDAESIVILTRFIEQSLQLPNLENDPQNP